MQFSVVDMHHQGVAQSTVPRHVQYAGMDRSHKGMGRIRTAYKPTPTACQATKVELVDTCAARLSACLVVMHVQKSGSIAAPMASIPITVKGLKSKGFVLSWTKYAGSIVAFENCKYH